MRKIFFIATIIVFCLSKAFAQSNIKWHKAAWANGICVADSINIFNRLPASLQPKISRGAWNQSVNSAGEYLLFNTSARTFVVKYVVKNRTFALPHMAATAVSGVDLYARDANGNWNWSPPAKYTFGDTCVYIYRDLKIAAKSPAEFYLYLPLYNVMAELTIGVNGSDFFEFKRSDEDRPVVAYGTSIMQGAVASRPGKAWTHLLSRELGREVINLGLSGNGRFEGPVIDIMAKTNAKVYILDCMPNLQNKNLYPTDTIRKRLSYAVKKIRESRPLTPIVFAEHPDGHILMSMDTTTVRLYHEASLTIDTLFHEFKSQGVKNIYLLTEKDLDFNIDDTTDGTHPNDVGMDKYAKAYAKLIRSIINEPKGTIITQQPTEQYRDGFDWRKRHLEIKENVALAKPETLLFGNSIINYWGGTPRPEKVAARGSLSWQKHMEPLKIQNAGFGNDRIENVLWRIYHGELDDFEGRNIIINIGTNNLSLNSDEEIVSGLSYLATQIRSRKPNARIYIGGILPRKGKLERIHSLNKYIEAMAKHQKLIYYDFAKFFLHNNGLDEALFLPDGLHPNEAGYTKLGILFSELLTKKF